MFSDIAYLTGAAQAAAASVLGTTAAALFVRGLPLTSPTRGSAIAWSLLIATAAVPNILVGYAYSPLFLPLVRFPALQSATYVLLVAAKLVPALTLIQALLPSALSDQGRHALTLSPHGTTWKFYIALRNFAPALTVAFALGFILAFNEFEIAAILGVSSWSVSVFDAHAGGLPTSDSIRLAISTLTVQAPVLILGIFALRSAIHLGRGTTVTSLSTTRFHKSSWILLVAITSTTAFIPISIVAAESSDGLVTALTRFPLVREIFASAYLALAATFLVLIVSRLIARSRTLAFAIVIPCLTGSLLIGLAVLAAFQLVPVESLRSGPIPAIVGLTLNALPISLSLWLLVRAASKRPTAHAARLSSSPLLRWRYSGLPIFGIAALVFVWVYYDVAITSILSPPGMTTAFERLHNLMHYGRTTALSAMVLIAFLTPILATATAWGIASLGFLLLSRKDRSTVPHPQPHSPPSDA